MKGRSLLIGDRETGARISHSALFDLRFRSLTMLVHPAAKKGISLPTLSPTSAAPNGDNTGIWVWSDL